MLTNRRISLKPFTENDCFIRKDVTDPTGADAQWAFGFGATLDAVRSTTDAFVPFTELGTTSFVISPETERFRLFITSPGTVDSCQTIAELNQDNPEICDSQLVCPESSDCCDFCEGACCIDCNCSQRSRVDCTENGGEFQGCGTPCIVDAPGACCYVENGICCKDDPNSDCDNCEVCSVSGEDECVNGGGKWTKCGDPLNCGCEIDSCDTSGCNCDDINCCVRNGLGEPVSCSAKSQEDCTNAGGSAVDDCENDCNGKCDDGSAYTLCCDGKSGSCGLRCCNGDNDSPIDDCDDCEITGVRYSCVKVPGNCTFECILNSAGTLTEEECTSGFCDPCNGVGGDNASNRCYCDFNTGNCKSTTPEDPLASCCACVCEDGDPGDACSVQKSSIIADPNDNITTEYFSTSGVSLVPANLASFGTVDSSTATKKKTSDFLEDRSIAKGILTSSLSASTLRTLADEFARQQSTLETDVSVRFSQGGGSTCRLCNSPGFQDQELPCPGGQPIMIGIEYDVKDLCINDEVKITVNRTVTGLNIFVDVKWFGYEEEFGQDRYIRAITDRFVFPKNAIYQLNGSPVGGVDPSSIEALCSSPCGLTYDCLDADKHPKYIFDPPLDIDSSQTDKKRDIRVINDEVGGAFPDRSFSARILGIGSAYDEYPYETEDDPYRPIYFVDNFGNITDIKVETYDQDLIRRASKTIEIGAAHALSDGYDGKFIAMPDEGIFGGQFDALHGYSCDCPPGGLAGASNPRAGCPTFNQTTGSTEERTGLITVSGSVKR